MPVPVLQPMVNTIGWPGVLAGVAAIAVAGGATALPVNTGFAPEAAFDEGNPPEGWLLRDQEDRALISQARFAMSGGNVFRFEFLQRGFGDNKLEQCVRLPEGTAESSISTWVWTEDPDDDLRVRFASEFYGSLDSCLTRDDQICERFDTDVSLGSFNDGE